MNEPIPPEADQTMVSVRSRAVQAVHSPLGFFVLALLIVESFLFGAGTLFSLSEAWRIAAIGVGVVLFLIVFGVVAWLVVHYPQNLVFSEESHVQFAAMRMYGTESRVLTGRDAEALPAASAPTPPTGQLLPASTENQ